MPTYALKATFEKDLALQRVQEMLSMGDDPEKIAEKLTVARDVQKIQSGIADANFARLYKDVEKLAEFLVLEKEVEDVKAGNWTFSFMGKGFSEKKIAKLNEKIRKFGSLLDSPKWFYGHNRVWLLEMIRDYALDGSVHGDSEWVDLETEPVEFPLMNMFEKGDFDYAKKVMEQLQKPYAEIDPYFVLREMEGHRALRFNIEAHTVVYEGIVRGQ
jgi:hypothetical protein